MSKVTDTFKEITSYDISKFLNDYILFINLHYSSVVGYYRGENIDKDAFNFLDYLNLETKKIDSLWEHYSQSFDLIDFWELIDLFEQIKIKLSTTNNLSRWLRSSRTDRFTENTIITYVQKQGESFEKITQKFGSTDRENDWVKVSIDNDLSEESYSSKGGVIMQVRLINNSNFELKNIVDTMTPENLYGKDIQKKLVLLDGDLVTLSGITSLIQTFDTLMLTNKGSIPEFPQDGLSDELIGSNVNIFNYPSIFRNLMNMFQKDDRFSELELVDIIRGEDNIFIKIQAKTKIGDTLKQDIIV